MESESKEDGVLQAPSWAGPRQDEEEESEFEGGGEMEQRRWEAAQSHPGLRGALLLIWM